MIHQTDSAAHTGFTNYTHLFIIMSLLFHLMMML